MGYELADEGGHRLAGDLAQDGDGLQVIARERPGGEAEDEQAAEEQGVEDGLVGEDAPAGLGGALGDGCA